MQIPAKSLLLVTAAVAALLWSCSGKEPFSAEAQSIKNRKPAADFTLRDANGTAVKLSDYRGKVVLLNFWATWCGPCTLEIPWFIEFEQQYKTQGFAVIGVSMDEEGWNAIKPYMAAHKMNYRVLLGDDSVSQLYGGVESLPTTFLIDRKGRVAFPPHIGLAGKNEYLKEIQGLLGEQQRTTSLVSAPLPLAALRFGPAK
jgi:cytochrome c biogenesis protein CcmG/thiol:disulfide interchange protein DsbE